MIAPAKLSPAKIAANIANAQASTGPRTEAGRATSSRNAITHGLFATHDFIRPGEEPLYEQSKATLNSELSPEGMLESSLANEIHRAMWRLRRCGQVEAAFLAISPPDPMQNDPMQDEATARLQHSVDRARAQSHRLLHKCTAELRKFQTERQFRKFRNESFEPGTDISHLGLCELSAVKKDIHRQVIASLNQHKLDEINELSSIFENNRAHVEAMTRQAEVTKQTQTPRNAQCPCHSGLKYKRCCGKNAPAILHAA